jgi:exosortase/archaeosortase family protein
MSQKPLKFKSSKEEGKAMQKAKLAKKEAYRQFMRQFKPLLIAVALWFAVNAVIHFPAFKADVSEFFLRFTYQSSILFGKLLFIPIDSRGFPMISVGGFTMKIIMECTAYNFYLFVIFLSLLSPVKLTQRLITLAISLSFVFVINSFRFYSMGLIGKYYGHLFDSVHDYLWNILFGFLVFFIWFWRFRVNTVESVPIS